LKASNETSLMTMSSSGDIATAQQRSKCPVALVRGPLVSTIRAFNNEATPAIGLAYVAGYLRKFGYPVTIVDGIGNALNRRWAHPDLSSYQCQGLTYDEIVEAIPADVRVIGFSVMFSGEWPVQRKLIERIRARFPHALIVGGGEHVTALTEYVLRECPALDLCVRGEGEHTFFEVVELFLNRQNPCSANGIGYLDEERNYVAAGNLPRIRRLADIPWPYWPEGYLEKFWEAGKSFGAQTERDMPLLVSRGCPYQCTFCSNPQMWTTRYVLREPEEVVQEIKHYKQKWNITSLQFYDLTAITKKRWTVDFCRRLVAEGIRLGWSLPSGTRSEALDGETLALLKEAGCTYLVYAPESGSPRTLERIKKRIELDRLTESILAARRLGIVVRANLILGFPGETRSDVFKTILFGLKLALLGVDEVPINLFSAYPGSELFDELHKAGRVTLSDAYFLSLTSLNSDFAHVNPMTMNETMGPKELAIYRLTAMLANYTISYLVRPARIWRTLRNVFGGGHQASTVLEHRLKDAFRRGSQQVVSG
jgi:anaerobic magnesium-protoporphyrin IX monomethyl ester cyclase